MAMLAAVALLHVVILAVASARLVEVPGGSPMAAARAMSATMASLSTVASVLVMVTGIGFFVWISRAFRAATDLDARPAGYTASSVIVGFLIPILNLFRPYQGLRALDTAIDPLLLPEPPPLPEVASHAGGYREAALAGRVAAFDARPPPLLGWWVLWLGHSAIGFLTFAVSKSWTAVWTIEILSAAVQVVSAVLAIVVVHRFDQRLMERARRLASRPT